MRFAIVDGEKLRPFKGGRGTCPICRSGVLAKCGTETAHHWAHQSREDCDAWSEDIGPWHLSWQDPVEDDYVEVVMGPHRADIRNAYGTVIELQHSPINPEEISEREEFYGDMVWVFDATKRFPAMPSGDRAFFSLQRTKHILACQKKVFLDCGKYIIEVEHFTDVLADFDGFGRRRDHRWFASEYLVHCLKPDQTPPALSVDDGVADRWRGKQPWRLTDFPTRWRHPETGKEMIFRKRTLYISLTYNWVNRAEKTKRPVWSDVIAQHPEIANGWSEADLREMLRFLRGEPMLIEGLLRVMPAPVKYIDVEQTVATIRNWLDKARMHHDAGRMPFIRQETEDKLLERAKEREKRLYGKLLLPNLEPKKERGGQRTLFD